MKIDKYAKLILLLIAISLSVIVVKQFFHSDPALATSTGKFSNVQLFQGINGKFYFFDTNTGILYNYSSLSEGVNRKYKLIELGKPLERID